MMNELATSAESTCWRVGSRRRPGGRVTTTVTRVYRAIVPSKTNRVLEDRCLKAEE